MSERGGIAGRLTEAGHELIQRVYFEDTDFSGRVYHARYLHFLERGRSDYLRLLGIHHRELAAEGMAFAVRRMEIDFLGPASIDDLLAVTTASDKPSGARILLRQEIAESTRLVLAARVVIVLIGQAGRPLRIPAHIRAAFEAAGPISGS